MTLKLISFDLQGTLCKHDFSTEVWCIILQKEFEKSKSILDKAEYDKLIEDFKTMPEDDLRYYDIDYWLGRCKSKLNTQSVSLAAKARPSLFLDMQKLVENLSKKVDLIIVSATTRQFIDIELGDWTYPFKKTYSTYDDFKVAGKTKDVFSKIALEFNLEDQQCLHIGDHFLMDYEAPKKAGWYSLYLASDLEAEQRIELTYQKIKSLINLGDFRLC